MSYALKSCLLTEASPFDEEPIEENFFGKLGRATALAGALTVGGGLPSMAHAKPPAAHAKQIKRTHADAMSLYRETNGVPPAKWRSKILPSFGKYGSMLSAYKDGIDMKERRTSSNAADQAKYDLAYRFGQLRKAESSAKLLKKNRTKFENDPGYAEWEKKRLEQIKKDFSGDKQLLNLFQHVLNH